MTNLPLSLDSINIKDMPLKERLKYLSTGLAYSIEKTHTQRAKTNDINPITHIILEHSSRGLISKELSTILTGNQVSDNNPSGPDTVLVHVEATFGPLNNQVTIDCYKSIILNDTQSDYEQVHVDFRGGSKLLNYQITVFKSI